MTNPSAQFSWFPWNWPAGWSWRERSIATAAIALPIIAPILGDRTGGWITGALVLLACFVVQRIVVRHGGWRLLGPHYYYDVVRLARRGQTIRLRVVYLLALFIGLGYAFYQAPIRRNWHANDFAAVSQNFAYMLFVIQNIAVLLLAPVYFASAIAQEQERRTLDLLFTTQLTSWEIVLGILFARLIHVAGFVLAGLPILCFVQFWGGIDMLLLVGNLANTLLNILTIGCVSLMVSAMVKTASRGVMVTYALLLPAGFCCMVSLSGGPFVLLDARTAGARFFTVQDLGLLSIVHATISSLCLGLAIATLRDNQALRPAKPIPFDQLRHAAPRRKSKEIPSRGNPTKFVAVELPVWPGRVVLPMDYIDSVKIAAEHPPVAENALLWKESYVGGPPFLVHLIQLFRLSRGLNLYVGSLSICFFCFWNLVLILDGDWKKWYAIVNFFYYLFLGALGISVALRASGSVARERQQQTLEPLLLLPIDRRDILQAKWLGALLRSWPWFALLFADVTLGLLIGLYHPFSAVLLILVPLPLIGFFASVGLLFSVTMSTVVRANLSMVFVYLVLMAAHVFSPSPLAYLDTFAFSLFQPREFSEFLHIYLLFSAVLTFFYVFAASCCWRLALRIFERRAHAMD